MAEIIAISVFLGGLAVALFIGAFAVVALQAKWRGYSFWLWLLAPAVIFNPVIPLVVLALMPNRKRIQMRDQFRAELDAKLAARSDSALAPASVGVAPSLAGSTMSERSLGDLPTIAPPERSLGDEATRG